MGNKGKRSTSQLAIWGLCGLVSMSSALASPPGARAGAAPHPDSRPSLDLRAPATSILAASKTESGFPSSLHRPSFGALEQVQLPELGASGRVPSRYEEFARRVHREGLPVARLWENRSALVSLGLNQRGKPGLWLIQKTH
jgi:hypothetical protein